MVSKLLLATQECYFSALVSGTDRAIIGRLKDHYYEIKNGIGLNKSPEKYGAFPMDAYSHTPANEGVKQPGLTGQVKEDIISRKGELGLQVKKGEIIFNPSLMNTNELLEEPGEFEYCSLWGKWEKIKLKPKQLAFTFCQVPVILSSSTHDRIHITDSSHGEISIPGLRLGGKHADGIFARNKHIEKIEVEFNTNGL
jgi:hypothetical protein